MGCVVHLVPSNTGTQGCSCILTTNVVLSTPPWASISGGCCKGWRSGGARHAGKREGDQRHAEPLFDELGTFAEHAYLPFRTHFCTLSRCEDKHGSNSTQAPKVLN
jgi:hypothetical protein